MQQPVAATSFRVRNWAIPIPLDEILIRQLTGCWKSRIYRPHSTGLTQSYPLNRQVPVEVVRIILETAAKALNSQPVTATSLLTSSFFHFDLHVATQRELLRYSGVCRTWRVIALELIHKRLVIPAFDGYQLDTTLFFSILDAKPLPGEVGLGWWTSRLDVLIGLHDNSGTNLLLQNTLDIREAFPNVQHLFLNECSPTYREPRPGCVCVARSILSQYQGSLTHLNWRGHLESFYEALVEIGGLPKLQVLKLELESAVLPSDTSIVLRFPSLRDLHFAGRVSNGVGNLDLFEMPRLRCFSIHHRLSQTPAFLDGIPSLHASAIKHLVIDSWSQSIAHHILIFCPNLTTIEIINPPREDISSLCRSKNLRHEFGLYEGHKYLAELIFHPFWVYRAQTLCDIQGVANRDLFPSLKKVRFLMKERSHGFYIPLDTVRLIYMLWQQTRSTGIQIVDGEDGEVLVPNGTTSCLTPFLQVLGSLTRLDHFSSLAFIEPIMFYITSTSMTCPPSGSHHFGVMDVSCAPLWDSHSDQ